MGAPHEAAGGAGGHRGGLFSVQGVCGCPRTAGSQQGCSSRLCHFLRMLAARSMDVPGVMLASPRWALERFCPPQTPLMHFLVHIIHYETQGCIATHSTALGALHPAPLHKPTLPRGGHWDTEVTALLALPPGRAQQGLGARCRGYSHVPRHQQGTLNTSLTPAAPSSTCSDFSPTKAPSQLVLHGPWQGSVGSLPWHSSPASCEDAAACTDICSCPVGDCASVLGTGAAGA